MSCTALMETFAPLIRLALSATLMLAVPSLARAQAGNIYQAVLAEADQKTEEVSTEQVRRILADGSAIVLDTRTHSEFVAGHIPGAWNLDAPSAAVAPRSSGW